MYPRPLSGGTVDSGMHRGGDGLHIQYDGGAWHDNQRCQSEPGAADRRSWSGGIDFKPTFRPDLTLSATYWHTEVKAV